MALGPIALADILVFTIKARNDGRRCARRHPGTIPGSEVKAGRQLRPPLAHRAGFQGAAPAPYIKKRRALRHGGVLSHLSSSALNHAHSGKIEFTVAACGDLIRDAAIFHRATIIAKGAANITPCHIAIDAGLPGIHLSEQ